MALQVAALPVLKLTPQGCEPSASAIDAVGLEPPNTGVSCGWAPAEMVGFVAVRLMVAAVTSTATAALELVVPAVTVST